MIKTSFLFLLIIMQIPLTFLGLILIFMGLLRDTILEGVLICLMGVFIFGIMVISKEWASKKLKEVI